MIVTISKKFDFDAAHRLTTLPEDHKCHRLHGHTYEVEVILRGKPDEHGFVIDYAEIAKAWQPVNDLLDHRYLNEIEGLEKPSTEVLAPFIARRLLPTLPLLHAIRVYESSTTWCEVLVSDL